jgi:NADPH2:quinone reductase
MKALQIREFGPPEKALSLQDVPEPQLGAGQILVRVAASCVQPFDLLLIAGTFPGVVAQGAIAGIEGAGVIARSNVPEWSEGTRVAFAGNGFNVHGAWAEYVALTPERDIVVKIPDTLADEAAGTMPTTFLTAARSLEAANFRPGGTVLLTNGTGAVGNALIQLALASGAAKVLVAARNAERARQLRSSGVEHVVDVSSEDLVTAVKQATGGKGADTAVDLVGGALGTAAVAALGDFGSVSLVGVASGSMDLTVSGIDVMLRGKTIRGYSIYPDMARYTAQHRAALTRAMALVAEGKIRPAVASVHPLAEAVAACGEVTRGKAGIGKAAIRIPA